MLIQLFSVWIIYFIGQQGKIFQEMIYVVWYDKSMVSMGWEWYNTRTAE